MRGVLWALALPGAHPGQPLPRRQDPTHPPFPADFLLIYSLFWKTDDGKPSCDFTNQKVWIIIWQSLNVLGEVGLLAALGELDPVAPH